MKDELLFCPLGGSGEIGMNMNLFAYGKPSEHKWIMVDIGVTFADDTLPGIDLIYPDPGFIVDRKDDLLGIVLTHAHEDHLGAVGHLFETLGRPVVYARAFTANLGRHKMDERGHDPKAIKTVGKFPETVTAGPFRVSFLPISHSIPESAGLMIETPAGRVVH